MIVHLDHKEICTALIEYIGNQGYPVAHKKVEVSLIAGRGKKGHSAQLSFEAVSTELPLAKTAQEDSDENQQAILFELHSES